MFTLHRRHKGKSFDHEKSKSTAMDDKKLNSVGTLTRQARTVTLVLHRIAALLAELIPTTAS